MERAKVHEVDGVRVNVACAEDVIVMKVLAGRPKDLQDIAAVVDALPDLDVTLVRETLALLERALDQGDLLPLFERLLASARHD